jgi:hypothetical protein
MRRLSPNTNGAIGTAKAAKSATPKEDVSSFSEISNGATEFRCGDTQASAPCALCHERRCPQPMRNLSWCGCRFDRKSRTDAEARVTAKADRQAALEQLGSAILEFAATPEGQRFLEIQQAELVAPRNDPEYLNAVLAKEADRQIAANEVTLVHHCVVWGRSRIGLTLKNDRDLATARNVAGKLQHLLEAELLFEPDPHDPTKLSDRTQKQPAKHSFGREKRSLGNEPKPSPKKTGTAAGGRK